jgi:hypothetical protein
VTFGCFLRSGGWPVSSCGESSRDWIRTTGSRCKPSDPASVRFGFTSPVHTGCFTWRRGGGAFEKKTQKTSARDLRIGRDRFRVLEKLRHKHGKEERG